MEKVPASAGASGHTGVFTASDQIIHCNYRDNGISKTGLNRAGSPLYVFRLNDKTSGSAVLKPGSSGSVDTKTEQAVKNALAQVGKRYVYGACRSQIVLIVVANLPCLQTSWFHH